MKDVYQNAGGGKRYQNSVFLFSDNDVVQESFLEDVNNILSSGLVPNLFNGEELGKIRDMVRKDFKKMGNLTETNDNLNEFFFNRVKDNLHIVICMSPIGRRFRDYIRMYPALVNNTTIDWFMKWPADALTEVANKYLKLMDIDQKYLDQLAMICC